MRLTPIDDQQAPPSQRGLFALLDDDGNQVAVGTLEVEGFAEGVLAVEQTCSVRFRARPVA